MKIDFLSLVRTHLGFPSEWQGKTVDGEGVKISYRYGKTQIFRNGVIVDTLTIDQFDVGGYMDDHVLKTLLKNNNYVD